MIRSVADIAVECMDLDVEGLVKKTFGEIVKYYV
jgi:hypothetical protein